MKNKHTPQKALEEAKKELSLLESAKDEMKDTLQRVQAEFENYKKRIEKESAQRCLCVKASFLKELLPIVDSFEKALEHPTEGEDFIKGMVLIQDQLLSMLKKEGIHPIDTGGKHFDPHLHEAMTHGEGEDGIILEELQKGYTMHDIIIRHSKVKVGKHDTDKKDHQDENHH
ncbi:MAG: nucleotide exchange factor GrpE [Nanoarchaeota archaeon]